MSLLSDVHLRYRAYCIAHEQTDPAEMVRLDVGRWPGGRMCGYTLWIRERWSDWRRARNRKDDRTAEGDHADFDEWLAVWLGFRMSP